MSTFGVFVESIESIQPHPNADRLEIAHLKGIGYPFVIGKGTFKVGDAVFYFPVDSVLPDPLIEKIGLTGRLAGTAKNRVKTIRLRGAISQGIVADLSILPIGAAQAALWADQVPEVNGRRDYAPLLGVTKYEPEERNSHGPNQSSVNMCPLPSGVSKYDIENCERWSEQVERMLDMPVVITEKLEGSHIALTRDQEGKTVLCTRRTSLAEDEETYWHVGAKNSRLYETLDMVCARYPGKQVTLRGELVGPSVQDNIYGLKQLEVYLFEIEVDGQPIDAQDFIEFATLQSPTPCVPLLAVLGTTLRDWLAGRDIRTASNGESELAECLREGVVIKPLREQTDPCLGRLFLKQRSPEYLATADT